MKNDISAVLILFGATGDLAFRKVIPSLYQLFNRGLLPSWFRVIGSSRRSLSEDQFQKRIEKSLKASKVDGNLDDFLRLFYFVSLGQEQDLGRLKPLIEKTEQEAPSPLHLVYYAATPPESFVPIIDGLKKHQLAFRNEQDLKLRRIVLEKPLGWDMQSAQELNSRLLEAFREQQLFRIDHYLGKETVQNILVTRLSNMIFVPIWNRDYISHIEISAAESLGVEERAAYYDRIGALRDMVQNHLLQLTALIAMEPPANQSPVAIRQEIAKLLQCLRPLSAEDVTKQTLRAQYRAGKGMPAYRKEKGVAPDSLTETYAALRFYIDNPRWQGVPFYLRTGKALMTRATEVVVHFKQPPIDYYKKDHCLSNRLVFRIQPDPGLLLNFGMKVPGIKLEMQQAGLEFHYASLKNKTDILDSYARLLLDALLGDSSLFSSWEAVKASWEFLRPILNAWQNDKSIAMYSYPAGSWGPSEAEKIFLSPCHHWRNPCRNHNLSEEQCLL